jgi:sarcosine oxidase subunit gamma
MVETYLRQSPLAHLGLERRAAEEATGATVVMAQRPFQALATLRGVPNSTKLKKAVKDTLGVTLPTSASTASTGAGHAILWLGPDEWLVVGAADAPSPISALAEALAGQHAAVVDVSDARVCITIRGDRARDVLAKGCPLDLHPRAFGPGRCAQTVLAKAHVLVYQSDDGPSFDLYVGRSFADYVWRWLEDAAREYGGIDVAPA